MEEQRSLTSTPWARWAALPWKIRRRGAVREMQARSATDLDTRISLLPFAHRAEDLPDVAQTVGDEPAPVWQYWADGRDAAPPVAQRCMESVERHVRDREVVVLDDATLGEYVDLPTSVLKKRDLIGSTHFSDILRVALLSQRGGTWIDATVYLTGRPEFLDAPFFAFTRPEDPFVLSVWFLASAPQQALSRAMLAMLIDFWNEREELAHYFQFHFLFEALITIDARRRREWVDVPVRSFVEPHLLQGRLHEPYDAAIAQQIIAATAVHKLTYKFERVTPGSFLAAVLDGSLESGVIAAS